MCGDQRAQFELDVLVRREFVFEFGLACRVTPIGFPESSGRVPGKLLFALETDAGAFSEAEDIFRFNVAIYRDVVILRLYAESGDQENWRSKNGRVCVANGGHFFFLICRVQGSTIMRTARVVE